jgi:hypothetical protein
MLADPDAFELQPITPTGYVISGDGALPSPMRDRGDISDRLLRRGSGSSTQSYELYTPDEDKRVLRKLDRKLVGFMALLYCLSFLDRSSELTN